MISPSFLAPFSIPGIHAAVVRGYTQARETNEPFYIVAHGVRVHVNAHVWAVNGMEMDASDAVHAVWNALVAKGGVQRGEDAV